MSLEIQNLFNDIPANQQQELFQTLAEGNGLRIERIVSEGHSTAEGEWYNQDRDEWVILLSGGAGLLFYGDVNPVTLKPGDHVMIPAGCRHRVEWTRTDQKTIWLAVHFSGTRPINCQ